MSVMFDEFLDRQLGQVERCSHVNNPRVTSCCCQGTRTPGTVDNGHPDGPWRRFASGSRGDAWRKLNLEMLEMCPRKSWEKTKGTPQKVFQAFSGHVFHIFSWHPSALQEDLVSACFRGWNIGTVKVPKSWVMALACAVSFRPSAILGMKVEAHRSRDGDLIVVRSSQKVWVSFVFCFVLVLRLSSSVAFFLQMTALLTSQLVWNIYRLSSYDYICRRTPYRIHAAQMRKQHKSKKKKCSIWLSLPPSDDLDPDLVRGASSGVTSIPPSQHGQGKSYKLWRC